MVINHLLTGMILQVPHLLLLKGWPNIVLSCSPADICPGCRGFAGQKTHVLLRDSMSSGGFGNSVFSVLSYSRYYCTTPSAQKCAHPPSTSAAAGGSATAPRYMGASHSNPQLHLNPRCHEQRLGRIPLRSTVSTPLWVSRDHHATESRIPLLNYLLGWPRLRSL